MVADDGRLTDNDTRAVIDGKVFAYLCAWMDVDTCLGMCQFGNEI